MRTTLTRMHRDERGMSLVFVGVGFMAFLAATTLAIDVGMFATARSQAQNSADAGALSGALALYFDDYNNRSASGPAVQSALAAARSNEVINRQVSVQPGAELGRLGGALGRCRALLRRLQQPISEWPCRPERACGVTKQRRDPPPGECAAG